MQIKNQLIEREDELLDPSVLLELTVSDIYAYACRIKGRKDRDYGNSKRSN